MKTVIIAVVAVIAIIGGAVLLSGNDSNEQATNGTPSNNFYGPEDAVLVVTEFADFQCPGCASIYPIVSSVKETFKDKVRFEFKHFPLPQIHQNATAAHRAAQAAALQGKFWEMHNILFERVSIWASSTNGPGLFRGYASEIGLDMTKYDQDVNSSGVLATINADVEQGKTLSVNSTPTFIIDGEIVDNTAIATPNDFSNYLIKELSEKLGIPEDVIKSEIQPTTPPPTLDGIPSQNSESQ